MTDRDIASRQAPALAPRPAVILVVDLVESVRLMQIDERGVITRLQAFAQFVAEELLAPDEGRLVKSLGDGLMVELATARQGVRAAAAMHRWWADVCAPLADGTRLAVRAGLHAADIFDGARDIYGVGVNLAARLATLAGAGETVASVEVKDLLVDSLDAEIEDLGDCHLKHIAAPVRAYRVGPAQRQTSLPKQGDDAQPLFASLAVIPFFNLLSATATDGLGDLIADGIIGQLSLSHDLRIVSRLSTASFRDRSLPLAEIAARLRVRYIVSGSYAVSGRSVTITAELADADSGQAVWSRRIVGPWKGLLSIESPLTHELSDALHRTLLETAVSKALAMPIPALPSYELFLGGVTLMHRASADAFEQSRRLLEGLVERHPRTALPRAWLGKWYVLRSSQGTAGDFPWAASQALEHTGRALDLEPSSALALAIEGFVYCHLKKDLGTAQERLQAACAANPSEGLAWLFLSVTHAFKGEADAALESARRALALSPMDPLRYYYESLMGSCQFAAGNFEEAIRWCESSRRRNRQHLSTLRVLAAANVAVDRLEAASAIAADILRLRPGYTVAAYEAGSIAAHAPSGRLICDGLRAAGIP